MTPTLRFILAATVLAWLLVPAEGLAQFDTPNRSFHNATGFPLEGRHLTVACESCHLNGQYQATPTTCFACHWQRRRDDPYETRLGTQCEQCHRPVAWTAVQWDHGGQAGMPLNASHRQLACVSCHTTRTFSLSSVQCVSCHQRDFAATTAPNHVAAGFPVTCESCHRPGDSAWQTGNGAAFNHNAIFPLVGAHAAQACQACHRGNVFQGTPRECVGCHRADYDRTAAPSHAAAGFPTTCETCHRPTDPSWRNGGGGPFNHSAVFPLQGAHAAQACAACHANNVYRGTPRDCIGCHRSEYDRTTAPSHAAAGFPTACESCHRPTDARWDGATFNHTAFFALVGRHAAATCASCHLNNTYRGTARDCAGCHLSDYNGTRDPNHAAAGFPTTCDSCHRNTDSSWDQGSFVHSWFPLSGHHNRPCAQCHTTPNNYSVFSCTVCHARGETDGHHREVGGYRYESTACYACHPNGRH